MEISLLGRRKIAVLFLLGVGIPSLALGYLAFRGIRNELALLEQRRLGEHRTLAGLVSDTIAARIAIVERTFIGAVADHADPLAPELTDSLAVWKEQEPLVEEVFLLEAPELRTGLPEGANLSEFGWSPNGERIVFMVLIGGEPEFWLISDFLPGGR
jgi:hypothetical protein